MLNETAKINIITRYCKSQQTPGSTQCWSSAGTARKHGPALNQHRLDTPQQTRDTSPTPDQCWPTVLYTGPTSVQTPGGRPAPAGLCSLEPNIIISTVRYKKVISVTIHSDRYDPNTENKNNIIQNYVIYKLLLLHATYHLLYLLSVYLSSPIPCLTNKSTVPRNLQLVDIISSNLSDIVAFTGKNYLLFITCLKSLYKGHSYIK